MRYLLLLLIMVHAGAAGAEVLSGRIDDQLESHTYYWGNSQYELFTQYSAHDGETDCWFYGTQYPWSGVDFYVYDDPGITINEIDATDFPYSNGLTLAREGDTVFFKGANGLYGAWRIDSIDPTGALSPYCTLRGYWFLQTDGTGQFYGSPAVDNESASWSDVKALYRK